MRSAAWTRPSTCGRCEQCSCTGLTAACPKQAGRFPTCLHWAGATAEDRAELASYCYEAGIDAKMLEEMAQQAEGAEPGESGTLQYEAYPLTMAVLRVFRASRHYRREILDKLALGSDTMLDLGNLYTAALPAWMAAGFEQALDEDSLHLARKS